MQKAALVPSPSAKAHAPEPLPASVATWPAGLTDIMRMFKSVA